MTIKISFLIAAHNEEKIIGETLANLSSLPYTNYEVLIGLDGCTDKTEQIVSSYSKKNKKFRYFSFNIRNGKPPVINALIKESKGDIIIVNDADWIFTVKSPESFQKLLSVFNNKKIGGIAESFPIEWDKEKLENGNIGYKMAAYSTYYWLEFQKKNFAKKEKDFFYIKSPTLFMTNIFRKKLYKPNTSLGDDFERTRDILNEGYEIIMFSDLSVPKMIPVYNSITLRDIFKQKIRTARARAQLSEKNLSIGKDYYLKSVSYILKESFKDSLYIGLLMLFWIILTATATFKSKFNRFSTQEGWKLRAQR